MRQPCPPESEQSIDITNTKVCMSLLGRFHRRGRCVGTKWIICLISSRSETLDVAEELYYNATVRMFSVMKLSN